MLSAITDQIMYILRVWWPHTEHKVTSLIRYIYSSIPLNYMYSILLQYYYTRDWTALLYHTVPYQTILEHTIQYQTIQHYTTICCTTLYDTTILSNISDTIQCSTLLYDSILDCTMVYQTMCNILYSMILCYTVNCYTILDLFTTLVYDTMPYYTILC